jgi:hypothetical protein
LIQHGFSPAKPNKAWWNRNPYTRLYLANLQKKARPVQAARFSIANSKKKLGFASSTQPTGFLLDDADAPLAEGRPVHHFTLGGSSR